MKYGQCCRGIGNAVPLPVKKRSEVKYFLMDFHGASEMISQWMTTNLSRTPEGFVWRFNLDGIAEMLNDYFVQDLWHVLESLSATKSMANQYPFGPSNTI